MSGWKVLVLLVVLNLNVCCGFNLNGTLEKVLELEEALGSEFRNGECFRDLKDIGTTLASNGSTTDKMWALKCKLKYLESYYYLWFFSFYLGLPWLLFV